jgi:hypothetical protein
MLGADLPMQVQGLAAPKATRRLALLLHRPSEIDATLRVTRKAQARTLYAGARVLLNFSSGSRDAAITAKRNLKHCVWRVRQNAQMFRIRRSL